MPFSSWWSQRSNHHSENGEREEEIHELGEITGFILNVIQLLCPQAASERSLAWEDLHTRPWIAFGSELSSLSSFHYWRHRLILHGPCGQSLSALLSCFDRSAVAFSVEAVLRCSNWNTTRIHSWFTVHRLNGPSEAQSPMWGNPLVLHLSCAMLRKQSSSWYIPMVATVMVVGQLVRVGIFTLDFCNIHTFPPGLRITTFMSLYNALFQNFLSAESSQAVMLEALPVRSPTGTQEGLSSAAPCAASPVTPRCFPGAASLSHSLSAQHSIIAGGETRRWRL